MNLSRITMLWLATLAAGAIFAGCGSSGDGANQVPKSLEERLFGGNEGDFAEQQKLIRECMVEQGFEYTPQDNRALDDAFPDDDRSEEFIQEYGFGISTRFATQIDISDRPEDPNQDYRESLDETQRKAYDKALYGQTFGGEFAGGGGAVVTSGVAIPIGGSGEVPADGEAPVFSGPGGCLGEALKATGAVPNEADASLFDDLEEMEERMMADPKMVEALKKWSKCMDDAGYDYDNFDAAEDEIRDEFAELTGLNIGGDGGFRITVGRSTQAGGEAPDAGEAFDPFANVDKTKLAELQAKERRVAGDAWKCAETTGGLKVEQQVREKYEEEFLAEHPELEAD